MLFLPSPSLTFFLTTSSISSLSVFFTSCLLCTSVPVSGEEEMGDSDVQAVRDLYLQSSMFNNIFHLSTSQPGIFYGYQALGLYAGSGLHEGVLSGWKEQHCRKSEGHGEDRALQQGLEGCLYEYMFTCKGWRYLGIFWDIWWHSLQVSKCGDSGCKEEPLAAEEERQVSSQNILKSQKLSEKKTLSVSITEIAFS